jgi:hypothetical protein
VIEPKQKCTVELSFQAAKTGHYTDALIIDFGAEGIVQKKICSLVARAREPQRANLALSNPSDADFGFVAENTKWKKFLYIVNTGNMVASQMNVQSNLSSSFRFSGDRYPGENGTCGKQLLPHQLCKIEIEVSAPKTSTAVRGHLKLAYFDTMERAFMLALSVQKHDVQMEKLEVDCVQQCKIRRAPTDITLEIRNTGNWPVNLQSFRGLSVDLNFSGGAFPGAQGSCGAQVNPFSSCFIQIEASLHSEAGSSVAGVEIQYEGTKGNQSLVVELEK